MNKEYAIRNRIDFKNMAKGNALFEKWKFYIGMDGCEDKGLLSEAQLREWSEKQKPHLTCVFCCNGTLDIDTRTCPRCHEYRGIWSYIESWNGYGEE